VLRAGLDRLGRRDVWRFVAVSQAVRAGLIANGVRSDQISVIPNGVDPARLREAASAEPPPTLRPAAARVGSVGRLERVKGTEYFLRAAARLAADHPDVRYVVAGTGSCERELRELAVDLGIAHLVEFLGYVGAAPPLIASLDIVIVPSLSEASGLTAMEAMALGVPVVASFAGGLSEVVENGRTGLLVPPADAEAIARAVARLLDNPELGRRLAAEGERHVAKRFTVGRMVDAYLALYEEILATQARRT
jgi:glycosyltransferase involved in cell wall biosynthesis